MNLRRGQRDVTLLAAGQAVSVTGDAAALVALLLQLRPAGSGWVAGLLAAELVPFIVCAPISGRIVDRVETRRVLLFALSGQALIAVPLALTATPWVTVALFALLNSLSTVVRPATSVLVRAAVGAQDAPRGYARLGTGAALGWIAGPALGGLITGAVGATTTLLLDAATFGVITVATALVRARRPPEHAVAEMGGQADRGGLKLIWQSSILRVALLACAVCTGCAVVDNVAAPFRFINQLGTSQFGYGLYLAVWGGGALFGVQILPRLRTRHHAPALAVGNLLMGVAIAGIGLAPTYTIALIASAAGGLGNGLVGVAQNALIAAHMPPALQGRVFAAAGATTQAAIGVGTAAAAPLVTALGAAHAMTAAGTLAALAALAALTCLRWSARAQPQPQSDSGVH